mgnify:CR=1 FL=1
MKRFVCVFIFVAMFAFSGCATTGGSGGASSGAAKASKSTWSDADYKRMGIDKGSYGNSY